MRFPSAFAAPGSLPTPTPRRRAHLTPRCAAQPPRRIGAVAKDVQEALQAALKSRQSRCTIELPPGARLGIEKRSDESSRSAGDRELCRLVASLFEGTGLSVHAQFATASEAAAARKKWGPLVECRIGSWDSESEEAKPAMSKRKGGFGKKKAAVPQVTAIGDDVDVLLVVAPNAGHMQRMRGLANRWGMDKLVLLLNCGPKTLERTPMDVMRYVDEEFEATYLYRPNPHPQWSGGVLFRKYPDDWVLCRQPPLGFLKQLLSSEERPSLEEIAEALQEEGEKPTTAVMNKLSGFLGGNE